ncbi:MAG TPA: hypothetical protein VNS46_18405 [Nocardioides sp.]|nr:hypothetical protein [Nocardioides sp.]
MEPQDATGLELDRLARRLLAAHGCADYVMTDPAVGAVLDEVRSAGDEVAFVRQLLRWIGHACCELDRLARARGDCWDLAALAEEAGEYGVPSELARALVCCLHLMELPDELTGGELDDEVAALLASYGAGGILGTSGFFVLVALRAAELQPEPASHQQVMARWFVAEECDRCDG